MSCSIADNCEGSSRLRVRVQNPTFIPKNMKPKNNHYRVIAGKVMTLRSCAGARRGGGHSCNKPP